MENNPLDERSVAGVRLSRDVYKHYTAQEIRDLKEIFDFFDYKRRGFGYDLFFYINTILYFLILEILNQKRLSMH